MKEAQDVAPPALEAVGELPGEDLLLAGWRVGVGGASAADGVVELFFQRVSRDTAERDSSAILSG
ncbi:hypothetical protein OS965_29050 [Streptomyces sp. H27-G5]|uniref:hypothetical protein n=1 Tax=Streptomyces sp. H27-G5 TaxID=2996698 RepID=UPI0022719A00|nr:hypothetical protein [Streptomyces sp. H27-G5]MCY0922158.1 hypothetical protein [Streptomyces sp. H27-G5]